MRAQDVMSEAVLSVTPRTTAEEAFQVMQRGGIHHVVVTEGARLVGLISDRDVGGRRGSSLRKGHDWPGTLSAEIAWAL